jgi:hypothetical protein
VLPRVSAALAQFIAPIATSGKQATSQDARAFERFKPKKESPGGKDPKGQSEQKETQDQKPTESQATELAQVIPFPQQEKNLATASPAPLIPVGVSQALMQLMNVLHGQRASILKWLG